MQGRSLLVLLVALLAVAAGAAAVAADDAADDPDPTKRVAAEEEARRLEGVWEVVYSEEDGTADPKRIGTRVVFAGGRVRFDDQPETNYRVEPRTRPARLDVYSVGLDPRLIGNQVDRPPFVFLGLQGIYEREGDRMTLCYSADRLAAARPTEFRTDEGSSFALLSLRQVKPKAK